MRPALLLVVLIAPLFAPVAAAQEPGDLLVTLAPGATLDPLPAGAHLVSVIHALVVPQASAALEAQIRGAPGVLRVERAQPIALTSDANLKLTRADPAPTAGALALTGQGVTVAIVDSGVDKTHPDLRGRVLANVKLIDGKFVDSPGDTNGHGTHVAGIVAADGSSSNGKWRGVAPGANVVGIDISEKFTTASALLAYDWLYQHRAEFGINVVVNAWGRVGEGHTFDSSDAEIRAIDRLVDSGVVVLFSASNHGPGLSTLSLEAQDPRVITVGAVDAAAQLSPYSSRGPVVPSNGADKWVKPDVVAPGENVIGLRSLTAAPDIEGDVDGTHRVYSGTSQAVPHVAGIVALMLEAKPDLPPREVASALRESAIDIGAPGPDDAAGFGLVDAADAVRRAMGDPADRGNVLIAGGSDVFEDETRLPAPQSASGILTLLNTPTGAWSTTFPVKDGASVVTFELTWSSPLAPVTVTLERDGVSQGQWTQPSTAGATAPSVVAGRLDGPHAGIWTLRAQGAAPAAVDVRSLVTVELSANPGRAADLDARYRLPDLPAVSQAAPPGGTATALAIAQRAALREPLMPIALAAGFLGAFVLLWPRPARAKPAPGVRVHLSELPPEDAPADDLAGVA